MMETFLASPLHGVDTTTSSLSEQLFETLTNFGLKSDARTQLLVLQILQLVQEYQASTRIVKDENRFISDWRSRPSESVDRLVYEDKISRLIGDKPYENSRNIFKQYEWNSYKTSTLSELNTFHDYLERLKLEIERKQILEDSSSSYFSIETLMEKEKIFVNRMRTNLLDLEEHELKLEKYLETLQQHQTLFLNEITNQKENIRNLENQLQSCLYISSSKMAEGKTKEFDFLEKQLQYCTRNTYALMLEVENKTRQVQDVSVNLRMKEEQLVNISTVLAFTLLHHCGCSCGKDSQTSISEEEKKFLDIQLKNCSTFSSMLQLQLQKKSNEVKELEAKLNIETSSQSELRKCYFESSTLLSKLRKTNITIQQQALQLQDKESRLQACLVNSTKIVITCDNTTREDPDLMIALNNISTLRTQLNNCSIFSSILWSELQQRTGEIGNMSKCLFDKEVLEGNVRNCTSLVSKIEEESKSLQEQISKLIKERENATFVSGNSSSMLVKLLFNETSDVKFLVTELQDGNFENGSMNDSINTMEIDTDFSNCPVNWKSLLGETENIHEIMLTAPDGTPCISTSSSVPKDLINGTNELPLFMYLLREREYLESDLKKCNDEKARLSNTSSDIEHFISLWRERNMLQNELQNCSKYSSDILLQLRNSSDELKQTSEKFRDGEKQLQQCSDDLSSAKALLNNRTSDIQGIREILKERDDLEGQLRNCFNDRVQCVRKLSNVSAEVQELETELKNNNSSAQNCSSFSEAIVSQLNNKTEMLQEQTEKLRDEERKLQQCSNDLLSVTANLNNRSSEIEGLPEILKERDALDTQLRNCSLDNFQYIIKLQNAEDEIEGLKSELNNTNCSEESFKNCSDYSKAIVSELNNKTKTLQEQTEKLRDEERKLQQCSNDLLSVTANLNNRTNEIENLPEILKERDRLGDQLRNCSFDNFQYIIKLRNAEDEMEGLKSELNNTNCSDENFKNCSDYSEAVVSELNNKTKMLQDSEMNFEQCSRNVSSLMTTLDNRTNEILNLRSDLNTERNSLQNWINNYFSLLRNRSQQLNDLTSKLDDMEHYESDFHNCTNFSSTLQNEIENLKNELNVGQNQNVMQCQARLLNCSNLVSSMRTELQDNTNTIQNLTSRLNTKSELESEMEQCSKNSTSLILELRDQSKLIENMTSQNKDLEGRVSQCTVFLYNISTDLDTKASELTDLVSKLSNDSAYVQNCSDVPTDVLAELKKTIEQIRDLISDLGDNTLLRNVMKYLETAGTVAGFGGDVLLHQRLMQFLAFLQTHANDISKWSSLQDAVVYGAPVVVQMWLDAGVDPNLPDRQGYTALQRASIAGNLQMVQLLVQYGASLTAIQRNQFGDLPIHLATAYNHPDLVNWMLDNKVPVDIRNQLGATALITAANNDRLNIATLLLDRGAEVNAQTNASNSDHRTALHEAAGRGFVDMVNLLLNRGADVNSVTSDEGQTPLHWAGKFCQMQTFNLLIQNRANAYLADRNGKTPLQLITACTRG
ncbi:putative leucine-rich repeat-containing protein DDB_G0290503 [Periplaneta americana]|uniref:putative leucine-rich repeat-containing protein DDB_G0290503 n=1 Tax=Periplaneta americana TaxID=6978 RepID=UPI0037E7C938